MAACWANSEKLITQAESSRARSPSCAICPTTCSHLRWAAPSAPLVLTVSSPTRVSTSAAWRWAAQALLARTARDSGPCSSRLVPITSGTASSGTQASGPPTQNMAAMKTAANGRSTRVVMVAEVRNSRTDSNSCSWLLRLPTDAGRAFISMPSTFSNTVAETVTSMRRPATSTK
ncbi:hypothetical protein D3C72_1483430 [compost metagenome]